MTYAIIFACLTAAYGFYLALEWSDRTIGERAFGLAACALGGWGFAMAVTFTFIGVLK
jgi:hypothetical protein